MIKKTAVNEYFEWLEGSINPDSRLYKTVSEYLNKERTVPEHEGPFLSVITRTQGKRKHMLAETLLCLQGQSNTNFELLIMAHNVDEEKSILINEIINDVPEWFREKIRVIPVQGGTRTTPLNRGFEEAKGEYIAILDDDDIVFDNWVNSFRDLAKDNNGKMLHTYAVDQEWEVVGEEEIPRAYGAPESTYCYSFDLKRQMGVNVCPLHSLAFPAFVFKEIGIKFDESLNTTEDWDFLMRMALFAGVADKKEITCIYRRWRNTENSQTLHDEEEWNKNYLYIVDRLRSMPMILLPNTYDDVFGKRGKYTKIMRPEDNQLFYDNGKGFTSTCMLTCQECEKSSDYLVEFSFEEDTKEVSAIRLDPTENGGIAIDNLEVKVQFVEGDERVYKLDDVIHNGIRLKKGEIVFLKDDPQLIIQFEKAERIRKVYVGYDLITPLNDDIIKRMLNNRSVLSKALGFVLRKVKGLLRRIVNVFR